MAAYKDKRVGTWYVKFRYKDWKNETKWVTKRGFPTKREAQAWEREFRTRQAGSLEMPFPDFVQVYLEDIAPRIKASTLITKTSIIQKHIVPYFGNLSMQEIESTDVLKWQNALLAYRDPETRRPFSKSYLKTVHNQLSAIFNHAVKFYRLPSNPARQVGNMGSENEIDMKFWTREEYRLFSEAMMDDPVAFYIFEILYWCGLREGEALALTPNDFDFTKKTISITKTFQVLHGKETITDPKTPQSRRTVTMPDFLNDEMQDYFRMIYDLNPTDRVFPVTKSYLHRKIHAGARAKGLPEIRVHDLRHSHVSLLIDMGYSAVAIAKRMGHKSIDITYRYAHLFPSAQEEMAKGLNDLKGA